MHLLMWDPYPPTPSNYFFFFSLHFIFLTLNMKKIYLLVIFLVHLVELLEYSKFKKIKYLKIIGPKFDS